MGLTINLETERGAILSTVGDPKNTLHRLLRATPPHASSCLGFIDWYGNTIFNYLQMDPFLIEWQALRGHAFDEEENRIISEVESLAVRCRNERHLYLKFIGD
jgi:hypothetical protein